METVKYTIPCHSCKNNFDIEEKIEENSEHTTTTLSKPCPSCKSWNEFEITGKVIDDSIYGDHD